MPEQPYFKLWIADWRGEASLREVSLAARAMWFEMLLLMQQSERPGYLVRHGKPFPIEALARCVGAGENEVKSLVNELENARVFSRENGIILCRKMVRDVKKAEKCAKEAEKQWQEKARKKAQREARKAKKNDPMGHPMGHPMGDVVGAPMGDPSPIPIPTLTPTPHPKANPNPIPAAAPPLQSPPPTPKNQTSVWNGEIREDQRAGIKAVWNSTPGHRASDHDLRYFAQACSAVERWEDGPPEAKANPPDWLIARAERFMASDQARKGNGECKGPLRKWFTEDRWMRSEEQEQDRTVSVPVEDLAEITLRKMGLA